MSSPEAWHETAYSMHATKGDLPVRRFWGVEVGLSPAGKKTDTQIRLTTKVPFGSNCKLVLDAMVSCRHST